MLQFGLIGDARNAPIMNLLLSLGPALVPAALGLAIAVRSNRSRPLLAGSLLALIALVVMHFVVLTGDASWVGFRAGQMILIAVPALVAAGLAATGRWQHVAIVTGIVALVVGLPTTVIDIYNAQDITNLAPGPGFPWTQVVDREQRDALDWVRRATPVTSTVQNDPLAHQMTTWSIIPSFGERRQAAGTPRTLVQDPEYTERSARVQTMFQTTNAREAYDLARALHIDYIWIDGTERSAYPAGMPKFDASPQFFAPAFRNDEIAIYRVE